MPSFMGYEKSLKDQLEKKYEVTLLNCDQYDKAILEEYKKCSKFWWMLRNLFSAIKERDQERAELYIAFSAPSGDCCGYYPGEGGFDQ